VGAPLKSLNYSTEKIPSNIHSSFRLSNFLFSLFPHFEINKCVFPKITGACSNILPSLQKHLKRASLQQIDTQNIAPTGRIKY